MHIFQSIKTKATQFYKLRKEKKKCDVKKSDRKKKKKAEGSGWIKKLVSKTIKTKNELVNKNEIKNEGQRYAN